MSHNLIITGLLGGTLLGGCAPVPVMEPSPNVVPSPPSYTAIGYGAMDSYKDHTPSEQRLLAIRAARMDAYRNLAEELAGLRIRGSTHMRATKVDEDSYRSYVDALVRGAKLKTITPRPDGIYEVELELVPLPAVVACLRTPSGDCLGRGNYAGYAPPYPYNPYGTYDPYWGYSYTGSYYGTYWPAAGYPTAVPYYPHTFSVY